MSPLLSKPDLWIRRTDHAILVLALRLQIKVPTIKGTPMFDGGQEHLPPILSLNAETMLFHIINFTMHMSVDFYVSIE